MFLDVRFRVLTAASMKFRVFWDRCQLAVVDRTAHFESVSQLRVSFLLKVS
jgi:hypothetical protein